MELGVFGSYISMPSLAQSNGTSFDFLLPFIAKAELVNATTGVDSNLGISSTCAA